MSEFIHPYSLRLAAYSGKERVAYRDYLERKSFVKDITNSSAKVQYAISESSREMIATHEQLQERGFELLESIDSGISGVNETLEDGFESLSYKLQDISQGLESLTAKCDWGFSQIIAEIGHTNDTLKELLSVAKTPAQTWAYNQFEIGRDAMRQGLYPEAGESFNRAISGFGDNTGYKLEYRFHYNLGILYLGDVKNLDPAILDLAKAEQAFLAAARYAKTDFSLEAGIAFAAAGWAAYCQAKLPDAEAHTRLAIQLDSKNSEAFYQLAKIQMHTDRPIEAAPNLRKAIEQDRDYMLKAATDLDFLKYEPQMQSLFEEMRKERGREAEKSICTAKEHFKIMSLWNTRENFLKETESVERLLDEAAEQFETKTYFGYLEAIEIAYIAKGSAGSIVKQQKEKLSTEVKETSDEVKSYRASILQMARNFNEVKFQEAERFYGQACQLIQSRITYEDHINCICRLNQAESLFIESVKGANQNIQSVLSQAEKTGWVFGAIKGCVLGLLIALIPALILGTIAEAIAKQFLLPSALDGLTDTQKVSAGTVGGIICISCFLIGALIGVYCCASDASRNARIERENEINEKR